MPWSLEALPVGLQGLLAGPALFVLAGVVLGVEALLDYLARRIGGAK